MMKSLMMSAGVLALTAVSASAERYTLRVGAGHPTALAYVGVWDTYFEENLKERAAELGYDIRLIEAWGTVASLDTVIETVSSGSLDIGIALPVFEPSTLELFNFGNRMPFTSNDPVLQTNVGIQMLNEVPALAASLAAYDVTPLAIAAGEAYGMALRNVPERPEDIAGLRIGSGSVNAPWTSAMGGIPITMPVNENYQAMQSGLLDGNIFFISGMETFRFHEVLDAYYVTEFGAAPAIVPVMNNETRDELPEDLVTLIDELVVDTALEIARVHAERDATFTEIVAENATVVTITPEDKARWAELLLPGTEEVVADLEARGLPGQEVFGTYVRLLKDGGYAFPVEYSFE